MAWDWGGAGGGALSGGAAGSQIMPGIGTAVGAGLGGLLGGKGGGKGGGPTPPDFMALATPNVNTPWSQTSWSQGPDGRYTQNFNLTGDAQGALTNLQANMLRASQMDPSKAREQAINQNMDFGMSRLNPMMEQQNQSFRAQMANSGLDPGTQAFNSANQQLGVRQSDLYNSMFTNAMNMGNETQRVQMDQANQPFNQYGSLINSSLQQPNMPNLAQAGAMQYGAAIGQQNRGAQGKGGLMSGIGGLGSALGGGKGGGKGGGGGGIPNYSGGANLGNYQLTPPSF